MPIILSLCLQDLTKDFAKHGLEEGNGEINLVTKVSLIRCSRPRPKVACPHITHTSIRRQQLVTHYSYKIVVKTDTITINPIKFNTVTIQIY